MPLSKVKCKLIGEDGNAFAIMGRFKNAAKKAGWKEAEIKTVLDKCMDGDYNNLLCTIMQHCDEDDDEGENND